MLYFVIERMVGSMLSLILLGLVILVSLILSVFSVVIPESSMLKKHGLLPSAKFLHQSNIAISLATSIVIPLLIWVSLVSAFLPPRYDAFVDKYEDIQIRSYAMKEEEGYAPDEIRENIIEEIENYNRDLDRAQGLYGNKWNGIFIDEKILSLKKIKNPFPSAKESSE